MSSLTRRQLTKSKGAHSEQKIIAINRLSLFPLTLVTSLGGDETYKFRDTFLRSKEWDRRTMEA